MYRRKGADYYRASPKEKEYFVSGIPARYWSVTPEHVSFSSFSQERPYHRKTQITLSAKKQHAFFDKLLNRETLRESAILGIGSLPSDDLAMTAAVVLAKKAIEFNFNVEFIDLGNPPPKWEEENLKVPDILVLHNITSETDYVRYMQCRDWIRWGEDSFRVVVFAGSNPVEFFDNRIRLPFDSAFYSEGQLILKRRSV